MYPLSDHYNGRIFLNPVPTDMMENGSYWKMLKKYFGRHPDRSPARPPGPFAVDRTVLADVPPGELRLTWLGHSTLLLDLDGKRFLTDPVWYDRASPFTRLGPRRFFQNPLSLDELPPIDCILLSHDHYDHLDRGAVLKLTRRGIPVITMLGVGARLKRWGVKQELVTELDWWQSLELEGGIRLTAAPARHFSGRGLNDRFRTLWGSFALHGPRHRVYYGADSGYFEGFRTIGERLGPFDLTLLEIGAYDPLWEPIHMGPEKAVQAHRELGGKLLLPIHWGTFALAFHRWTEPVERLVREAERAGVDLLLPVPGETWKVDGRPYSSGWWQAGRAG